MSYETLVLDQDSNFHLISLSILFTFFLDNLWILSGEFTFQSPPGDKGLTSLIKSNKCYLFVRTRDMSLVK